MARGNQFAQPHLIGDIVEDLAQALPVATVRRRRDPEDAGVGIGFAHPVDDAAVALGEPRIFTSASASTSFVTTTRE